MKNKFFLFCLHLMLFDVVQASSLQENRISIIVTVYNKEHQIAQVIKGIIKNATIPYELIVVFDGCVDQSEQQVMKTISKTDDKNLLKELKVLHTPDVNEIQANNAGMKVAQGKYWILVQDDMQVTEKGWDKKIIEPLKKFNDVFAVSAKWAASYQEFTSNWGIQKYVNAFSPSKNKDIFAVRDVVCRGPLALNGKYMQELGYFDQAYSPLYLDDHDLCTRAYKDFKYVCGGYYIGFRQLSPSTPRPGQVQKPMSNGEYFIDVVKRNRKLFWDRYKNYFVNNFHDENRKMK